MFGIRVGKLSALGDCPRWTQAAPSLSKQPLASTFSLSAVHLFFFNLMPVAYSSEFVGHSAENLNKLTLNRLVFLLTQFFSVPQTHGSPPPLNLCHFQSQHTTKC
ncbi:hypothetical protein AMECASPLE_000775 [Ameca splendens]|uniref:Uncharacterized protein n=1 Tax=Ameca splendens TaxID=208324 RepID=A0ABV1A512_9TELE